MLFANEGLRPPPSPHPPLFGAIQLFKAIHASEKKNNVITMFALGGGCADRTRNEGRDTIMCARVFPAL